MCGRFTLQSPADDIRYLFDLEDPVDLPPRYNIAPTQDVACIVRPRGEDRRRLRMMRWGLVPFFAKDPSVGSRMINARSETVAEKSSFREAFQRRRCLVVADGFYEWEKTAAGKQPWHIRRKDRGVLAFAGLFERWRPSSGRALETCTIVTTRANELVLPLHDRMPVVLDVRHFDLWLDPEEGSPALLLPLLTPCASVEMEAVRVSRLVNSPANDDPRCLEPAGISG